MTPYEFLCVEHMAAVDEDPDEGEWWMRAPDLGECLLCAAPAAFARMSDAEAAFLIADRLHRPATPPIGVTERLDDVQRTLDEILRLGTGARAPVTVMLKTSSQKGGQDGFEVSATSAATLEDVAQAVAAAVEARRLARLALGMADSLEAQLAASLAGNGDE